MFLYLQQAERSALGPSLPSDRIDWEAAAWRSSTAASSSKKAAESAPTPAQPEAAVIETIDSLGGWIATMVRGGRIGGTCGSSFESSIKAPDFIQPTRPLFMT